MKLDQTAFEKIVKKNTGHSLINGATFRLENANGSRVYTASAGNMTEDATYYIASINKMMLSALTLGLVHEKKISLTDKISTYLPEYLIKGLHRIKGEELTSFITIQHLLSQTSGLPCYLTDKRPDGTKLMQELLQGKDRKMTVEDVAEQVKGMKVKFAPGQKGKATYGNTNFRILSRILENTTGRPVSDLLTHMFRELGMNSSFVFTGNNQQPTHPFFVKDRPLLLPEYFSSSGYDVFSTTKDQVIFLKAFFNGHFFPVEELKELQQWNNIFFPFRYGIGLQQFYTPRIFSPFKRIPSLIGHCGSVGTAAFFSPEHDVYISATVNQVQKPQLLFQTLVRIINQL